MSAPTPTRAERIAKIAALLDQANGHSMMPIIGALALIAMKDIIDNPGVPSEDVPVIVFFGQCVTADVQHNARARAFIQAHTS